MFRQGERLSQCEGKSHPLNAGALKVGKWLTQRLFRRRGV
jgi:hypothetical protein